jgi:hypothetical protein
MLSDIYQEFARNVEGTGVPASGKHAPAKDEIDVLAVTDAETDPDVP